MNRFENIINPKTGIFNRISEELEYIPPFPFHYCAVHRNLLLDNDYNIRVGGGENSLGFSFDSKEEAYMKAIGEGIERYCAGTSVESEIIIGSYNDLAKQRYNLLNPLDVTRYSKEQIQKDNLKGISKDTVFHWVEGKNELNGKKTMIPANLVFLANELREINSHPIRDITSTGLATGSSINQAKENGLLECIERDAFMIMWLNKLSMPRIIPETINSKSINLILEICQELDLELNIIDITNDIKVPSFFVLLKNKRNRPIYIQVGAKSHYDPLIAIEGAVEEAIMLFNLQGHLRKIESVDITDRRNIRDFTDHIAYYALGNGLEHLEFLTEGPLVPFDRINKKEIGSYSELKQTLYNHNLDFYTCDITTSDVKDIGLFVYRTIVPKLAFLDVRFPCLECERLYTVPLKLGYKPLGGEFNVMPHPFP